MKSNAALLALATGAAAAAAAAAQANVVSFDLKRRAAGVGATAGRPKLVRRAATPFAESLINNLTSGGYYAEVSVGTPGQSMTMLLDTGSSDTWVVAYDADLCTSRQEQAYYETTCSATFNPNASSTYKMVQQDAFQIEYLDGSGSEGSYISDDFTIGGTTVKSLQMGYATKTSTGQGLIGMGFDTNEASEDIYPDIIDDLASQGLIQSKSFSLYLNDVRSESGTILFGGVDTDKFIGTLGIMPMLKDPGAINYMDYEVGLSAVSVVFSNGTNVPSTLGGSSLPAILDSGTTLSYLPDVTLKPLVAALGAYTDDEVTGLTFINCDYLTADPSFTLSFSFGNGSGVATIALPVSETVLDMFDDTLGTLPEGIPFDNVCLFGMQSMGDADPTGDGGDGGDGDDGGDSEKKMKRNTKRQSGGDGGEDSYIYALLGDTFLRSAYVVYDLTAAQVGLAQANLNSSETSVTALGTAGLSAMTGVAAQQTTATGAGATQPTTTGTGSGSGSGSGSGGTQTSSGGQTTVTVTKPASAGTRPVAPIGDAAVVLLVSVACAVAGGAFFVI